MQNNCCSWIFPFGNSFTCVFTTCTNYDLERAKRCRFVFHYFWLLIKWMEFDFDFWLFWFGFRWSTAILPAWIPARTARASARNSSTLSTPVSSRTSSRGRSTTDCSSIRSSGGRRARRIPSTLRITLTGSSISGTPCRRWRARARLWTAARRGRPTSKKCFTSSSTFDCRIKFSFFSPEEGRTSLKYLKKNWFREIFLEMHFVKLPFSSSNFERKKKEKKWEKIFFVVLRKKVTRMKWNES